MTSFISFARKRKQDSTFDSVCTRCYETVATGKNEANVAEAEQAHFCEPAERIDIHRLVS
jgi:hypothetical protein